MSKSYVFEDVSGSAASSPAGADASSLLQLGQAVPDFTAQSTAGQISLSDYLGRWVVLFGYPADFDPVCTTEAIGFAESQKRFASMNTKLLGLSVDGIYSHIAWMRNIEEKFAIKIDFPIIADTQMQVSKLFGMLGTGDFAARSVRATFVIDSEQILRAMVFYPPSIGRSVAEIVRLILALQLEREKGYVTPEGWRPGDKVILPAPDTQRDAEERMLNHPGNVDWYFTLQNFGKKKADQ